ncbi:MAG: hypothetical protein AABY22_13100 [Nanoarchaeota archaeon]
MKTFDIAIKYLKGVDYSKAGIISFDEKEMEETEDTKRFHEIIVAQHDKYDLNIENEELQEDNGYYRNLVFVTATLHLIAKAKGFISFFDVAIEIIESEIDVVETKFELYKNTVYPKAMVDKWDMYSEEIEDQPQYAFINGAFRLDMFFVAYHYLVESKVTQE